MRSFASSSALNPSWSALARSTLVVFLACGSLAEGPPSELSSALTGAPSRRPQHRHEGRATELLELAREVGAPRVRSLSRALVAVEIAEPSLASLADAGAVTSPGSVADASDSLDLADAGLTQPGTGAVPPVPPPLEPALPEALPRDIVERSRLPIYGLEAGVTLSEGALWDRLAQSPAICFGEYHDEPAHHYAQARALVELDARARAAGNILAVGFEMIQRPFQASLSAYAAGALGEPEFLAQVQYDQRWGFDFALYRPLFEGAREHHLPALALNMRAEITRKVARTGLESLDASELAELPELVLDDAEHRAFIFGLFGVLPEHGADFGLEDIYKAQTIWDETMADTSAEWLSETGTRARLLDFAGAVHCQRSAIPRRITRRTPEQPALSVHAVFESELAGGSFEAEGYDLLVVLDD